MPALEVRGLTRRFGAVEALRGIDVDVASGEIVGLIGPDGAGKTTAIRAVCGLIAPDAGTVRVFGEDPSEGGEARERIGLLPQQYSLYGDLSVAENLRFFADLFCIAERDFRERRERLLAITRLARFTDRRTDSLSGGMYKKLALACALLHQPDVLLLDEPTNGVDPVSRRELWALLYEFVGSGMAVLVSTPYMDEAARCHRVHLIHQGRILASGSPAELVRDFDHEVVELAADDRDAVEARLGAMAEVLAVSPSGERLRVVLRPGGRGAVEAALGGAALLPATPGFEDVFLARTEEAA